MNLYIIRDVLCDYTSGMCVIAAESLSRCEQIFIKEFICDEDSDFIKECKQKEFNEAPIKVIENVPYEKEEVVSYLYGSSGG
jgi:hypothetical protein